eukprot:UN31428
MFIFDRFRKHFRLIIRNLSFQCNEKHVEKAFKKYGNVKEVSLPKNEDGRMKGFGFVQFDNVISAKKAMHELNGSRIIGREIAIDWALGKKNFQKRHKKECKT